MVIHLVPLFNLGRYQTEQHRYFKSLDVITIEFPACSDNKLNGLGNILIKLVLRF